MKRFLALIVATMLFAVPVYAENYEVSSTLIYTQDDSFCIQIPETIYVGEQSVIEAVEMNIAPNKTVYVDLNHVDGYVEINSVNDPSSSMNVYFRSDTGTDLNVTNLTLASFASGDNTLKEFSTYTDGTDNPVAGEYTGSVSFYIHCD
jgi:hypothetical protein